MISHFSANRLSDIPTTDQGLKKLIAVHTDFYCDVDLAVETAKNRSQGEFAAVHKLFDIDLPTPLYLYLSNKNKALAPVLSSAIKQMKTEGLIERYRLEAIRSSHTSSSAGDE